MEVGLALATLGGLAVVGWLGLLLSPATGWRLRPQAEDDEPPPGPEPWPAVSVLIPARNESRMLRCALPSILDQDYPGPWRIVLVDDRSSDGTTPSAAKLAQDHPAGGRLKVVAGDPLPDGWVGKVWALEQGARALADEPPAYVLLTDADIAHAPWSLRTLVSQSEHQGLALNSRMARLHCRSRPERLLIPAFVYFFNLLYPMRRVNRPASSIAAAAGGCMLVRWDALAETGGFEGIRSEIIDDVNLARQLKSPARPIRLALSRSTVRSTRRYQRVAPIWRMVRRTAFDELRYSWLRLAGTVLGMSLLFVVPPALVGLAVAAAIARAAGAGDLAWGWLAIAGASGLAAYALMSISLGPAVRLFELPRRWQLVLPLAGLMYGGMSIDSALQHAHGRRRRW